MRSPLSTRRPLARIALTSMLSSALAFGATLYALKPILVVGWYDDAPIYPSLTQIGQVIWQAAWSGLGKTTLLNWLNHPELTVTFVGAHVYAVLDEADLWSRVVKLIGLSALNATLASTATWFVGMVLSQPQNALNHRQGRRLLSQYPALRSAHRHENAVRKATGTGIRLAPGLTISRERETRHLMIVGGTGSGKTVILRDIQAQILDRGDRAIIHDTKGDVLETLPVNEHDYMLLAPNDQRSAVWDISADILTEQDAIEFAASLIAESKEPLWADGARMILTGCIVDLLLSHRRQPTWSWADLSGRVFAPPRALHAMIRSAYPKALSYVDIDEHGNFTRTGSSFVATMRAAAASTLIPLEKAWGHPSNNRVSIRNYLKDDAPAKRIIILQRAPHLPNLSKAWIGAFVKIMANLAVGPILNDSTQRRIWMLLDEFPQLGKLEGFDQIIEKGRSRGLCVIMGLQDFNQLRELYDDEATDTWISSVGMKIILRVSAGSSANMICEDIVGKRLVDWVEQSSAHAGWRPYDGGNSNTRTTSIKSQELQVIDAAFLESELGRRDTIVGPIIRGLVIGIGPDVLQLSWPIVAWPGRRAPSIVADWNR